MTDIDIVKFGRFKERFSAGENIFKSVVENILFRFDDGIFVRVVDSGHANQFPLLKSFDIPMNEKFICLDISVNEILAMDELNSRSQ